MSVAKGCRKNLNLHPFICLTIYFSYCRNISVDSFWIMKPGEIINVRKKQKRRQMSVEEGCG